jgi:hypothetical protein
MEEVRAELGDFSGSFFVPQTQEKKVKRPTEAATPPNTGA